LGLAVRPSEFGNEILIASHNSGKVKEISDLLSPLGFRVRSAAELKLAEPEETGSTFAENARIKSRAAARASGLPALADDSGLEVAALGKQPGIYSARWAGPSKDFALAMRNVEEKLQAAGARTPQQRRAEFVCVLSLSWTGDHHREFEGRVSGQLVWPPRGSKGFGYDPIFRPDGYDLTFGEMEPERKHEISHRARAFRKLVEFLR
jgi:XTP/dITP diphosphohydrolase